MAASFPTSSCSTNATSYPDGAESADGSLYLIDDQQRYTRGAQQILFPKITEADILAGSARCCCD